MTVPGTATDPQTSAVAQELSAREPTASATHTADFIELFARALHRFGTPAHRLEEALVAVSKRLGVQGQFFSTPTALFAAFDHPDLARTRLLRVEPGEINLEKLSLLDAELARATSRAVDIQRAQARIAAVLDTPPRYGRTSTTAAFALSSAAAAHFFGGGVAEILGAGLAGLLIGLLALLVEVWPSAGRLFELLAALIAAFATTALAGLWGGMAPFLATLAGLIVLVPGLGLTTAMTELATRNLVSGASRLAGALLTFVTLGFGVAVGNRLGVALVGSVDIVPTAATMPVWSEPLALLVAAGAFTVLFRAHPRDCGWILAAAALALYGSRVGSETLGPELGALTGAALVGLASNLHARWLDRPAAVTQVPGLMLLVPGSVGFRSVAALLERDTLSGVQTAFSMTLVAVALVTGLLVANILVPPRRIL